MLLGATKMRRETILDQVGQPALRVELDVLAVWRLELYISVVVYVEFQIAGHSTSPLTSSSSGGLYQVVTQYKQASPAEQTFSGHAQCEDLGESILFLSQHT